MAPDLAYPLASLVIWTNSFAASLALIAVFNLLVVGEIGRHFTGLALVLSLCGISAQWLPGRFIPEPLGMVLFAAVGLLIACLFVSKISGKLKNSATRKVLWIIGYVSLSVAIVPVGVSVAAGFVIIAMKAYSQW
jgi:hypothetical protein